MTTVKLLPLLLCGLLLSGCTTTTITNLTPSQQQRNSNGFYPFEAAWDSRQYTVRKESIRPYVIIDEKTFPMQPAPVLKNRWETMIPIPADKKFVYYRYKFDFDYDAIPQKRSSSKLSSPFRLEIIDK